MTKPSPWATIETLPSANADEIAAWHGELSRADDPESRVHALVGVALSLYWAAQTGASSSTWAELAAKRTAAVDEAVALARQHEAADLAAKALLGRLYATWGPDSVATRATDVDELATRVDAIEEVELRLRAREWLVLSRFDAGDLAGARREIARFTAGLDDTREPMFHRRVALWQANLAMLEGRLDEAVRLNQSTISHTADSAGAPFSFQNVAITLAVERFFRRGLDDVIDTISSIRASSPRVGANWEVGLAFALAESDRLDEAREIFDSLARNDFEVITRDLNWLVTMLLLAMVAIRLDDQPRCATLLALLKHASHLDATHGFGYCSYGPVGRVVGSLAAKSGDLDLATSTFEQVLQTRDPGPWTTLCRLDRAIAFAASTPNAAIADARQAEAEFRSLGLTNWAEEARALWVDTSLDGHGRPLARQDRSGQWQLVHASGRAHLPDGVGLAHLTTLLGRPGHQFDVADLDRSDPPEDSRAPSVMSTLDEPARRSYLQRLFELDALGRPLRSDEAEEAEFLKRQLAGGRYSPSVSKELERTRVRVTKAIHRELSRIGQQSAELGQHLTESIETGRHCIYAPADGQGWDIIRT